MSQAASFRHSLPESRGSVEPNLLTSQKPIPSSQHTPLSSKRKHLFLYIFRKKRNQKKEKENLEILSNLIDLITRFQPRLIRQSNHRSGSRYHHEVHFTSVDRFFHPSRDLVRSCLRPPDDRPYHIYRQIGSSWILNQPAHPNRLPRYRTKTAVGKDDDLRTRDV